MMNRFNTCCLQLIMGVLLLYAAGCKAPGHVSRAESFKLPEHYGIITESSNIAELPWREMFSDEYLNALIDTALRNNFNLQVALQRIEIARASYNQTRAPLLPSVSGVATAGVERLSKNSFNRLNNPNSSLVSDIFLGFQSTWEIDIWKRLRNNRKAAYTRFLASEQALHLLETTIVSEIARLYYTLLTLDSEQAIIQRNIDLQKSIVDIITIQKQGGRATELAVQQSRAQLLNTQSLQADYRQRILETENEMNILLGRLPVKIQRSTVLPDTDLVAQYQVGIPSELLRRRPDLVQAELELQALEADLEAARTAFLPSLTITPFAGVNAMNPGKLLSPSSLAFGIASGLAAPVFNRIQIQSAYDRTLASNRESFYNYEQTIVSAYSEVVNNLNRIKNIDAQLTLMEEETRTLRDAVNISKDLYLAGYATYLEVIVAQENVLAAELEFISSKNRMYQSGIDLYRSLGGGWDSQAR